MVPCELDPCKENTAGKRTPPTHFKDEELGAPVEVHEGLPVPRPVLGLGDGTEDRGPQQERALQRHQGLGHSPGSDKEARQQHLGGSQQKSTHFMGCVLINT